MTITENKMATTNSVSAVAPALPKRRRTPVATAPAGKAASRKAAPQVTAKPVAKKSSAIAKPAVKPALKPLVQAKAEKPAKMKKPKLVRDSFTIPKAEYTVLDELKQRAGKLESSVKKSELLRAGIKALAAMSNVAFLAALKAVPAIKTGRPTRD